MKKVDYSKLGASAVPIITLLRSHPAGLTYDRIAAWLHLEPRTLASHLGKLTQQGYLERLGRGQSAAGVSAFIYAIPAHLAHSPLPDEPLALFAPVSQTLAQRIEACILTIGRGGHNEIAAQTIVEMVLQESLGTTRSYRPDHSEKHPDLSLCDVAHQSYFKGKQRRLVYAALRHAWRTEGKGLTREQIGARMGIFMSTVCPRVHELLNDGYISVQKTWVNPLTGNAWDVLIPNDQFDFDDTEKNSGPGAIIATLTTCVLDRISLAIQKETSFCACVRDILAFVDSAIPEIFV